MPEITTKAGTEKIISKIEKLLALANNNPNQAEAEQALLKAQALMAEYDVEVSLNPDKKPEYELVKTITPGDKGFRAALSMIISRNFRCQVIIVSDVICFFGHKTDAKICKEAFEYAYKVAKKNGDKEYGRRAKLGMNTKNVFNSYVMGFMKGIEVVLGEQCTALMIVTPPDVKEAFAEKFQKCGTYKGGMKSNGFVRDTYEKGISDGKDHFGKKLLK